MANCKEIRDIPLDDLVIGKGQVRTANVGAEIDELAESIAKQGLLQPIVVCQADKNSKYEILTGQRRFLAHKQLGKETITAVILDEKVSEANAKIISITENLVRRQLTGKELIDGITFLYHHYGSISSIVEETGISYEKVRAYVKFPRLNQKLKDLVQDNQVDIKVALKAQDAATDDEGKVDDKVAKQLALEMEEMSGAQRKNVVNEIQNNNTPVDEAIENAKTGSKITQIIATVTQDTHSAIGRVAKEENTNQDEATVLLIEEALVSRGHLQR